MTRFIRNTQWFCIGVLIVFCFARCSEALAVEFSACMAKPATITVVMYNNRGSLTRQYKRLSGERVFNLRGFTTLNNRTGIYTLHVLMIDSPRSPALETLGHELTHALCGDWHPDVPEHAIEASE